MGTCAPCDAADMGPCDAADMGPCDAADMGACAPCDAAFFTSTHLHAWACVLCAEGWWGHQQGDRNIAWEHRPGLWPLPFHPKQWIPWMLKLLTLTYASAGG